MDRRKIIGTRTNAKDISRTCETRWSRCKNLKAPCLQHKKCHTNLKDSNLYQPSLAGLMIECSKKREPEKMSLLASGLPVSKRSGEEYSLRTSTTVTFAGVCDRRRSCGCTGRLGSSPFPAYSSHSQGHKLYIRHQKQTNIYVLLPRLYHPRT
jgi:hypothetical protein